MEKNKFKLSVFYSEVKEELKKVNWPSKEQTIGTTLVVVAVVVIVTIYLGIIDMGFSEMITRMLG
ncbi:MAG: preprotein translocase subunit SecE [Deferribacteraceae bacterium]|jgi:preprotein translocase subunit SecE|nr:preprotein translocase subunit SecE [Deferribacteraceae bacterium]